MCGLSIEYMRRFFLGSFVNANRSSHFFVPVGGLIVLHKNNYQSMTKERISYSDLGAGIMILWMILGHALGVSWNLQLYGLWDVTDLSLLPKGVPTYLDDEGKVHNLYPSVVFPFLSFFMPWFFYKSGQFFSHRTIADEWKKDWGKLMRQFLIWSAFGYILYVGFCYIEGNFTLRQLTYRVLKTFILEGNIKLNTPLWFLFTLFGVRQIANILLPKNDSKFYWIQCIAIILLGYIVSYAAYRYNHRLLPEWVANGSTGLAFFTMGYCLKKYETKWWLLIPGLIVYAACCIYEFPVVSMKSNFLHSGKYLLYMPTCLCGIVVFNMVCRLISKYIPFLSRPFEYIGIYAMIIYVSHGLLYRPIYNILYDFELTSLMPYSLWIILASYVIFLPLFCVLSDRINRKKQTDIKTTNP